MGSLLSFRLLPLASTIAALVSGRAEAITFCRYYAGKENGFPIILLLRTSPPLLSPLLPSLVSCFDFVFVCLFVSNYKHNKDWTTKGALLHLITNQ